MKKYLLSILAATCVLLTACNTVDGVGKDIQKGGQAISSASDYSASE